MSTITTQTYLERCRAELGWAPRAHTPQWQFVRVNERFIWIMDGDRAVGLLDEVESNFELRVADPWAPCPPAVLPKHYHICTYVGLRVINDWRMRGFATKLAQRTLTFGVDGDAAVFTVREDYADGSHGTHASRLIFDPAWGGYVVEYDVELVARRIITEQEFCNLIPAAIGDTRPGKAKYQQVIWLDREGTLRGMGKNPLWFTSVGAQDQCGRRGIAAGGFLAWVAEPDFNPAIEILHANTGAGAGTCDALMDEHLMVGVPDARHCPDGWFHLEITARLFSIPVPLAQALAARTTPLDFGPMLAWKFQYAPHDGPIAADLNKVELPGLAYDHIADMNTPVPWDRPAWCQLWTASNQSDADLYYDPAVGHAGTRSLRISVQGKEKRFCPGSGPTYHTEAGVRYRVSAWVRTQGNVRAWVEGNEILFTSWNAVQSHPTAVVGPDSDWTYVEATYTARGDDAPFAVVFIVAEGEGMAWFDEIGCVPV